MERKIFRVIKNPLAGTDREKRLAVVEFHDGLGMLEMDIPEFPEGTVLDFNGGEFRISGYDPAGKTDREKNTERLCKIRDAYEFYLSVRDMIPYADYRQIAKKYAGNLAFFFHENPYFFFSTAFFDPEEIAEYSFSPKDIIRHIIPRTFEERRQEILAMIEYALVLSEKNGNTGMLYKDLYKTVSDAMAEAGHPLSADNGEHNLTAFINFSNAFFRENTEENSMRFCMDPVHVTMDTVVYRKHIYDLEYNICKKVKTWLEHKNTVLIDEIRDERLSGEQRRAIEGCFKEENINIITGGPGTGKTTVIDAIIDRVLSHDKNAAVCVTAPTGRATKRIKESLCARRNVKICTIHKLVGYGKKQGEEPGTDRQYRLIIIDESSMLPLDVFYMLLKSASPDITKLILIGDVDQLPSVDAGNIFEDLINLGIPTSRLTRNYRSGGYITEFAGKINKGIMDMNILSPYRGTDDLNGTSQGLFFRDISGCSPEAVIKMVTEAAAYLQRGEDTWTVMLSKREWDIFSAESLNMRIAQQYRKRHPDRNIWYDYMEGDLVMACRTNYDPSDNKNYYNGDIGHVIYGSSSGKEIEYKVKLHGESSDTFISGNDLSLAYAMTVHKSQGSEYDTVLILIPKGDLHISKKLLYTAITRAKKTAVIFSTPDMLERAVHCEEKRVTLLSGMNPFPGKITEAKS